jgi:hypothetical protein
LPKTHSPPHPLAPPKFSKIKFQKITPNFPPKNHAKLSPRIQRPKKSRQTFRQKITPNFRQKSNPQTFRQNYHAKFSLQK